MDASFSASASEPSATNNLAFDRYNGKEIHNVFSTPRFSVRRVATLEASVSASCATPVRGEERCVKCLEFDASINNRKKKDEKVPKEASSVASDPRASQQRAVRFDPSTGAAWEMLSSTRARNASVPEDVQF